MSTLVIKPLREYQVYAVSFTGKDMPADTFTADGYEVEGSRTIFYRTGNIVREYQTRIGKIIVTPVDENA